MLCNHHRFRKWILNYTISIEIKFYANTYGLTTDIWHRYLAWSNYNLLKCSSGSRLKFRDTMILIFDLSMKRFIVSQIPWTWTHILWYLIMNQSIRLHMSGEMKLFVEWIKTRQLWNNMLVVQLCIIIILKDTNEYVSNSGYFKEIPVTCCIWKLINWRLFYR